MARSLLIVSVTLLLIICALVNADTVQEVNAGNPGPITNIGGATSVSSETNVKGEAQAAIGVGNQAHKHTDSDRAQNDDDDVDDDDVADDEVSDDDVADDDVADADIADNDDD